MRTMLEVRIPVEAGNSAAASGELPTTLGAIIEKIKPEATYFVTDNDGRRRAMFFFDLADVSDIPAIAEPLFMKFNAAVQFAPTMNLEDLQAGIAKTEAASS